PRHGSLRGRGRSGAAAAAPDPDDLVRVHLRRGAAGLGDRRRRRIAPDAGHRGVLRHDRGHRLRPHLHAGVLCGVPLDCSASERAASGARGAGRAGGVARSTYCMNQPWLTTSDWPVYTVDEAAAKNRTASATSSVVVNSPSTVSFNMTLRMTSSSEMPSSLACSGICLSTRGVLTNPGQMTFAVVLCSAPSFAMTRHSPSSTCLAVT